MKSRLPVVLAAIAAGALPLVLTLGPSFVGRLWPLVVGAGVLAAVVFLGSTLSATTLAVLAIASQMFAGNAGQLGLPMSPDRVLWPLAVAALVREWWVNGARARVHIVWKPVHFCMLASAVYVLLSALWANTLFTNLGLFALVDRIAVPFLLFALAPLLFRTTYQRNALLLALVAVGAYLGITAVFEIFGPTALIFPHDIANPAIGAHFGRARGPFLEAAGNGLVLFQCAVAAAVAAHLWHRPAAKRTALAITGLCLFGAFLTLTRAVWLGSLLGGGAAMLSTPRLRRLIPSVAVIGVAGLILVFVLVPTLSDKTYGRATDQGPIWDRLNTNDAALQIVQDKPLLGIGWERFIDQSPDYLRQRDDIPLPFNTIEVHNVFLSRAAELGLVGLALWLAALVLAAGGALATRAPAPLQPWRVGFVAVALCWLVLANSTPLSYPMPNAIFWLWAGVVLGPSLGEINRAGAGVANARVHAES